jgi:uncharacterized protein YlxW (UPF0749 family)
MTIGHFFGHLPNTACRAAENDVSKVREIINEAKITCCDETKSKCQKEITTLNAKVISLDSELKTLRRKFAIEKSAES